MKLSTIRNSNKKTGDELQAYLQIMRKHNAVPPKKGKGVKYNRAKHKKIMSNAGL
jgi:hypothetical protein